jgi:hypothetical protein
LRLSGKAAGWRCVGFGGVGDRLSGCGGSCGGVNRGMLARLILALLLAAFAFPAVAPAACHDASASRGSGVVMDMAAMGGAQEAMSDHGSDHQAGHEAPDRKATPLHGCIGCVPPSNWDGARVLGVALREPAVVTGRVAVLDLGAGVAPALRPPREA